MTPMQPNNPLLTVDGLACGYTSRPVLNEICFSASSGETVSILGPNGCGKTTLLKTIACSLPPLKGIIRLGGKDIRKITRKERALTIAVVMQGIESAQMSVEDYVMLGRLPHFQKFQFFETAADRKIVHHFLEMTDTFKLKDMQFNQISGGEKQLVAIARALVQQPSLLLMDEPTSHLDISHQTHILNLVTRIKHELKIGVVMVVHDLNLACEYADTIVLIDSEKKSIYGMGKPADVINCESIKTVYKTDVLVAANPVSQNPCVFLINNALQKIKKES